MSLNWMVTPYSVGALYPIHFFSHPVHVFGRRSASLPKFKFLFLWRQSFRSRCSHICYAPTSCTHAYSPRYSCICRCSCAPNPKGVPFLIFKWFLGNTVYATHIFCIDIFLLFFLFSFFGRFLRYISCWCIKEWFVRFLVRLEVNLMTLRVVTFFHTFSPCWCNF